MNLNQDKSIEYGRALRAHETEAEKILWEKLRAKRLNGVKFRRQHPLKGYIVDFYCHKYNVIIEVDGSSHDNRQEQDAFRQKELILKTEASFLRFTNEDILYHLDSVLESISAHIRAKRKPTREQNLKPSTSPYPPSP